MLAARNTPSETSAALIRGKPDKNWSIIRFCRKTEVSSGSVAIRGDSRRTKRHSKHISIQKQKSTAPSNPTIQSPPIKQFPSLPQEGAAAEGPHPPIPHPSIPPPVTPTNRLSISTPIWYRLRCSSPLDVVLAPLTAGCDAMGSSSQHYRDTAPSSTEDWRNISANSSLTEDVRWLREARPYEWDEAVSALRWAWDVHVFGLASLFSALSVLCLLTVLRLKAQLTQRPHMASLNILLGLLAACRTVVLFADPYGSRQALPAVLLQLLVDLGYPCLVSAFALLQLSLARTTQLQTMGWRLLGTESAVTVAITFHFCLIITSGVLGALQHSLRIVWLLTQIVFIIWGGFLCFSSLLSCLKLLRSIVKVPLQFLRQVDPGYEITSILQQGGGGMLTDEQQQQRQLPQPRIRITDVNEHTYSYASEGSLATSRGIVMSPPQHADTSPLTYLPPSSPKHWKSSDAKRSTPTSPNEDPAVMKPLITVHRFQDEENKAQTPMSSISTVQSPQPTTPQEQLSSPHVTQVRLEDFHFDARKLKRQSRSHMEKQLRRLVVAACLGVMLCLLKAYDVLGPHGLLPYGPNLRPTSILPWFCFQTINRLVEFIMACTMVSMSQQSLNNHYYHYNY
ncbi:hypothetical protein JTE90_023192 [Oedothorax gibbosus]|uniref:Proline-rich transmembrane protein 3/4 domain-containing protein n=1 Tax=Oedothorax gibbosus TaxID=931172 RepID=A0AAV6UJJ3_9ARAC|nr:hypothetical protein JTE90_023192 [Oedothorax gibbosus]